MRLRASTWPLAVLLGSLTLASAFADGLPPVPVRIGNHEGYSRLVFNLPTRTDYHVTQEGQHVVVQFAGDVMLGAANGVPRNVLTVTSDAGRAEIVVAPGTIVRDWRLGNVVVIDFADRDAAADKPTPQQAQTAQPPPAKLSPGITPPAALVAQAVQPPPTKPSSGVTPPAAPAAQGAQPPPTKPSAGVTPPAAPAAQGTQPHPAKPSPGATPPAATAAQGVQPPPPKPWAGFTPPAASAAQAAQPPPAKPLSGVTPLAAPAAQATQLSPINPPPDVTLPAAPTGEAARTPPAEALPAQQSGAPSAPTKLEETNPQHEPIPAPAAPSDTMRASATQPASAAAADDTATSGYEAGLVVPSGPQLGVAIFRGSRAALIVFDQPITIDISPLRDDPIFGGASVQKLQTATVIRLPLDPAMALSPSRTRDAWRITAVPLEPTLRPIQAAVVDDRLVLRAADVGSVISLVDPDTGTTLLVGTQRRNGQGVPMLRKSAEFTLLPTWQGVAVEPNADTIALRPTPQGFMVAGAVTLSPSSDITDLLAGSAGLTRHFDFPSQPTAILLKNMRRQVTEAAAAAPLARGPYRQTVARTMIALGLGVEAGAMLNMAATDDPHEAGSPDSMALASIAALLAHRPDDANGLVDPRLPATDDIALWRAVRLAQLTPGSAPAAAMFAATLPLLLTYPSEIRDRLLPLAAETLVAAGDIATAAALLDARKDDAALDMARAMLREAKGDNTGALAGYDRLAQSRDRLLHARAAARAVELRLAAGAIDAKQAAERLDGLLYSWRGDRQERVLRERLAELKARTGGWRSALALLRDSETLFPDDKVAIHGELSDMFAGLLRDDTADSLAPLELVSVVEENADLLPTGRDGAALQAKLADRLVALDLPKRAGPVLEKLMKAATTDVARAGFGARLAALRLRESDMAGAMAALDASVAADLPVELAERRTLLVADADARRGDGTHALAVLATLDSAAADGARATILERANDWPAAQRALADYAAKTVPAEGALDDAQRRTLLRLATAAARAGDNAALTALSRRETARMGSGPLADMFRLLTADQISSVADLKRSGQETALARELPGQLKALQVSARPTR